MITAIDVWNVRQLANKVLNLPPIDCHYPKNKGFCDGCEPGNYFERASCKRLRAWCMGCDDSDFDLCDDCYADKYREEKEEAIA